MASAQAELRRLVWSGFETTDEIVEHIEWTWGWDEPLDTAWLRDELKAEFEKKRRDETSWPTTTDNDRLERAFAALEAHGIIALHNAGYTQQDGMSDVSERSHGARIRDARKSQIITGWCFYTGQDIKTALDSHGLWIAFGDFDGDRDRALSVARTIKRVLEHEGLRVEWNGEPGQRLRISPFDWRKRGAR
ncbi:MAG: hypothetical protein E6Q88_09845 [Lysobacteraceae bacterium]|nr:MAG: hypothetical protein E6Q88_09845 [Xanthomonadaceae bacterium]